MRKRFVLLLCLSFFLLFSLALAQDKGFYDEDEFVGVDQAQSQSIPQPPEPTTPTPAAANEEAKILAPRVRTNYYLEYFYGSFIIIYIINFWVGKNKNESIAKNWAHSVGKTFRNQFSSVGTSANEDSETNNSPNFVLVKETQNVFTVQATGRNNCVGLQATLTLKKRHDLLSLFLNLFLKPADLVTVDILMNDDVSSFVFALLRKREQKKYIKANPDLPLFCGTSGSSVDGLNSCFVVASEFDEVTHSLLIPEVLATLNNYEHLVQRIHISDQGILSSKNKNSLSFEFKLPDPSEMNQIQTLTRMAIYFIDLIATIKLSKLAKQKAEKSRQMATELNEKLIHQQRQEAAQQRKIDKLQKEKLRYESMSPEAQKKFEEKQHKKQLKQKQPHVKVLHG